ncbi:GDSL-type esterase/lipase family protein [Nocardioides caldifontis]|uniref:GDSL-type esterase/lipase family protein n=1 Tax=Nocardioides caldifontis TaxID=2588938 RepID=UPI0011E05630|nr:GDSL-type esterase/lipase family protein [Nocardioides caldifontis]
MTAALVALLSCLAATFVVAPPVSVAGAPLTPDPTPAVDGVVTALAAAGDRVVLAGDFGEVGGEQRSNVAALTADGGLDPRFAPEVDGPVAAVAASPDGGTVFLAGSFDEVDGVARDGLAAVDATTGRLLRRWHPDPHAGVAALAVHGGRLLLGGEDGVRSVRLDDGTAAGFRLSTDGPVRALVTHGRRVHLGGDFTTVEDLPRAGLATALTGGTLTSFSPAELGDPVRALAVSGERLFTAAGDQVAAYLPGRSDLPTWTSRQPGPVRALAAGTHTVFVGGATLTGLGLPDGSASTWKLPVTGGDGPAAALLTAQGLVVGGGFDAVGGHARTNLVRVPTGRPDAVVWAGQDLRLRDDAPVTLAGTVRLPAATDPVEVTWRQTAGAAVALTPVGPAVATFTPNPGRDTLAFELVATDARGNRWRDAVTVDIVATPTVAVIGDSLTARVDARRDPPTRESTTRALLVDAGWDPGSIFWWARGGKTLTTPDRAGRTTFGDVRAATAALGGPVDLVYVGLGTNDSSTTAEEFGRRLAPVLDALDASGAGHVVWMGLGFRDLDDPRAQRLTPVLEEQVAARGWTLVDFAAQMHAEDVFDPQDWLFADQPADRVHLTAQGYAKRDALMVEALVAARDR